MLGAIAQMVEHLFCTQEVVGSSPTGSMLLNRILNFVLINVRLYCIIIFIMLFQVILSNELNAYSGCLGDRKR